MDIGRDPCVRVIMGSLKRQDGTLLSSNPDQGGHATAIEGKWGTYSNHHTVGGGGVGGGFLNLSRLRIDAGKGAAGRIKGGHCVKNSRPGGF